MNVIIMRRLKLGAALLLCGNGILAPSVTAQGVPQGAPQAAVAFRAPDAALVRDLMAVIDAHAAAGFSGSVLVGNGERELLNEARGLADREKKRKNTVDTRFNLGSGDKLFTKIAIGQLAAAGKLSMTDTVGKFLPDYPNETIRRKATIQHLLRHSSGLGSYWNDAYYANRLKLRTLADVVPLFSSDPLAFEPGERMGYSNGGFILLGRIIEVVSGQSYYDYVQRHVFDAAGMKATAYLTVDETASKAIGYTAETGPSATPGGAAMQPGQPSPPQTAFLPNTWSLAYRGSSAGGGYSTTRDLFSLDKALKSGAVMPTSLGTQLFMRGPGGRQILANGGGSGANFEFDRFGDYTIIVMANMDPSAATQLMQALAAVLTRAP